MNKHLLDLIVERTAIECELKRAEFADVFGTETDESPCVDGSQVADWSASEGTGNLVSGNSVPSHTIH